MPEDCHGIRWLSVDDLIETNKYIIQQTTPAEAIGVREMSLLESAQDAPAKTRYYKQTEDIFLLAAVLFNRIIRNHPFHNGNKRTAYLAASELLTLNGYDLNGPHDEILILCEETACRMHQEAEIATWLANNSSPL